MCVCAHVSWGNKSMRKGGCGGDGIMLPLCYRLPQGLSSCGRCNINKAFARHRLRDWDLGEKEGRKAILACHMEEASICESSQYPTKKAIFHKMELSRSIHLSYNECLRACLITYWRIDQHWSNCVWRDLKMKFWYTVNFCRNVVLIWSNIYSLIHSLDFYSFISG